MREAALTRPRRAVTARSTRRRVLASAAAAGLALLVPACRRETSSDARTLPAAGLRVDLNHTVRDGEERFALVRLAREAAPPSRYGDAPDWGDYRLTLVDAGTNGVLSTTGFDSNIAAIADAASTTLCVRCTLPASAFTLNVEKRRPGGVFQNVLSSGVDPWRVGEAQALAARIDAIVQNGAPSDKVDLAIVGDGYTEDEHAKFDADAKRAAAYLFSVEPFRSRSHDFNVNTVFVESAQSGVTDSHLGERRESAFGCAYGSGAGERTLSVGDETKLRDAAAALAYDVLLVAVNSRRYGGSAYFGGPAVVAMDSAAARYLVLHELGHALAGLAEEYYIPYGDGPTYRGNVEPWQPNVTTALETRKWATPQSIPSRWNKTQYERYFANYVRRYSALRAGGASESAIEKLMREAAGRQAVLLGRERAVGLYEGAAGYSKGVYRAETDCIMFSLQTQYYCAACTAALGRAIDAHVRK
jgi:hypothetical protein